MKTSTSDPALEMRLARALPQRLRSRLGGRLGAETVEVPGLDGATRERMWALYSAHYERVDEGRFFADLDGKHHAILLRDLASEELHGFSTLRVDTVETAGRRYRIVYSGDTIITDDYQRQTALHREFVRYIMRVAGKSRGLPVYWFLISKGYRTYLLLSRNFNEYWPRVDRAMPGEMVTLRDTLALERFGEAYDAARGVLRFDPPGPRLRDGVAPVTAGALAAEDVRFFVESNPGHADGDELCCLGRVDLALAASYAWRLVRKAVKRRVGR